MSRWGVSATVSGVLLLAGCAGQAVREVDRVEYSQRVDGQLLAEQGGVGGGAAISRYEPQPFQRFRMPRALQAPGPRLPEQAARRELAATRVCARVAIASDGTVMFANNLHDRAECAAGADPVNVVLVDAMLAALRGWTFRPAALCSYPAGADAPDDPGECEAATRVEPVPVTLQFAFTFEVHEGRVRVRDEGVAR